MILLIKYETGFRGKVKSESESCSVLSDSLQTQGLNNPWNSPGQNARVGSCSLLQGIFLTQGLNPGLPHRSWILYQLSLQGGPSSFFFFFFFFFKALISSFFHSANIQICICGANPHCFYPSYSGAWLWPLFTQAILSAGFAASRVEEMSSPETKSRVAYCLVQNS